MNRTDEKIWAQEMCLAAIDAMIKEYMASIEGGSLDDEIILKKQRNRIAKFLGFKDIKP